MQNANITRIRQTFTSYYFYAFGISFLILVFLFGAEDIREERTEREQLNIFALVKVNNEVNTESSSTTYEE